jgi:hypothetical protein
LETLKMAFLRRELFRNRRFEHVVTSVH